MSLLRSLPGAEKDIGELEGRRPVSSQGAG